MAADSPPSREAFRPLRHRPPDGAAGRVLFGLRLALDLQMAGVYRDLRRFLAGRRGRILDVGCGGSPFRHLVDARLAAYTGIDVEQAADFGYRDPAVTYFDGVNIPFPKESFDAVMCTEVLEHVAEPGPLLAEIRRVLKPGGEAIFTVPWSARFHYQPFDYHRYTPAMLAKLISPIGEIAVRPRGTDLTSISGKVIVAYFRNLRRFGQIWAIPFRLAGAVLGAPCLAAAVLLGQLSLRLGLGADDDPLGYTVLVRPRKIAS